MDKSSINFVKIDKYDIDCLSYDLKDLFSFLNANLICVGDEIYGAYEVLKVYNGIEIRIGLNANKRNKGYGSELFNVVFHKVGMEYSEYPDIKLFIRPGNKASIGMAKKCGFKIDEEDLLENESEGYLMYYKENPYYGRNDKHVRK